MIFSKSKYQQKKLVELDQLIFPELKMKKDMQIVPKAFDFSLRVLELYIELLKVNEFDLSEKLLKSGTGIRTTIEDSLATVDRQERFNSIALASREAVEVRYWLKLIQMKYFISGSVLDDCVEKINEIINLLNIMSGEGSKNKELINSINFN
ncbi:four helix bundle protein [Cytophagaceae bacterium ABcell3]|nr:four helix bundle protein [Cytophagaceae bacterium ABcell3]